MGVMPRLTLDVFGLASDKPISTSVSDQNSGLLTSTNKQPPVIGCAQNLPYTGFIDEVRAWGGDLNTHETCSIGSKPGCVRLCAIERDYPAVTPACV